MKMSDDITKIAPAIVAVQNAMTVVKDAEGVHNSKYATLGAILATVRPSLEENGLTVIQSMETTEKLLICSTRIMHVSGQWIESEAAVTAGGLTPQLYGAAISYARRYGICAALSIATPDDDLDDEKMQKAYSKAEEKEAHKAELRKYQAAILVRLVKYDAEPIALAFEEFGYVSEKEDKEEMVCELIKQTHSKSDLRQIGVRCMELQAEIEESLK